MPVHIEKGHDEKGPQESNGYQKTIVMPSRSKSKNATFKLKWLNSVTI